MKRLIILSIIFALSATISIKAQREVKMQVADTTEVLKRYVFMLLNEGPNRNQDSISVDKIMAGHLKQIREMAKAGKVVVAGPFDNGGKFRGILIFDVDSIAEAVRIESSDPAVITGRLEMQCFYWWTMKGSRLP